jgi:hypothetical protein
MGAAGTFGLSLLGGFIVLALFTNVRTLGNAINLNTVTLST